MQLPLREAGPSWSCSLDFVSHRSTWLSGRQEVGGFQSNWRPRQAWYSALLLLYSAVVNFEHILPQFPAYHHIFPMSSVSCVWCSLWKWKEVLVNHPSRFVLLNVELNLHSFLVGSWICPAVRVDYWKILYHDVSRVIILESFWNSVFARLFGCLADGFDNFISTLGFLFGNLTRHSQIPWHHISDHNVACQSYP